MAVKFFTGITKEFTPITQTVVGNTLVQVKAVQNIGLPIVKLNQFGVGGVVSMERIDVSNMQQPVFSADSMVAPYSSLFDKFDLQAEPVYNYFVPNETTEDVSSYRGEPLHEIPRYIRLSWKPAPKLRKRQVEIVDKRLRIHYDSLPQTTPMTRFDGISTIKNTTVNGHVAPLAIRAVIDLVEESDTKLTVDLDGFLADASLGRSYNELVSNLRSMQQPASPVSADNSGLVDGKFLTVKSPSGQAITLKSGQPSSPNISVSMTAVKSNTKTTSAGVKLLSAVSTVTQQMTPVKPTVKAVFVEPNITGLIRPDKLNGVSRPEHAESMTALSSMIPAFEFITPTLPITPRPFDIIPQVPAPVNEEGVEYVGYVIEKYLRRGSGAFELVEEIDLDDISTTEYIDLKVVYGGFYRYRIKTIAKWTRPPNVNVAGTVVNNASDDKFSQTRHSSPNAASYFDGDWCRSWAYAAVLDLVPPEPPDEVMVYPDSRRKRVMVTWKVPDDHQRDISGFVLLRRNISEDGMLGSVWKQLGVFQPTNGFFFDTEVSHKEDIGDFGYVYAMQSLSIHAERSTLSEQIATWLTRDHKELGELPLRQVSERGVEESMHGAYSVKPVIQKQNDLVAKDIVSLSGRTGQSVSALGSKDFVLRLHSLDTGETRDITVAMAYVDVGAKRTELRPKPVFRPFRK